ncbi:MAG: toxin-antitoxin system YwqK family antitoxin [Cytophagales bacterium]|nr:MAG: toxin-antitoxin system YwqK family antitoxin [Cytophagales bacterium]
MARQAPSRSRNWLWATLWLLQAGCQSNTTPSVPDRFARTDQPGWQRWEGLLWLQNRPFSGWQVEVNPQGDTLALGGFLNGRAEGTHRRWYANGRLREERRYRNNWQEGQQQGWFPSGKRAFVYSFRGDVYEGNCKEWYENGRLARDVNYHNGQEEGRQRHWFADGSLKMNYVVREGRTYGFTGTKNCVNVWDSINTAH